MQLGLRPRISQDINWRLSVFTCCPCIFNSGECQLLVLLHHDHYSLSMLCGDLRNEEGSRLFFKKNGEIWSTKVFLWAH